MAGLMATLFMGVMVCAEALQLHSLCPAGSECFEVEPHAFDRLVHTLLGGCHNALRVELLRGLNQTGGRTGVYRHIRA